MKWYLKSLKQYADFKGRARRKEYWMFTLFHIIIAGLVSLLGIMTGSIEVQVGLIGIYILATLIPSMSLFIRRLHDTGKSGWMAFLGLIPVVGGIIIFVFTVQDSEKGENKWGTNLKENN